MSDSPTQHDAIRISEARDGASQVILHPQDNDLFIRTGRQVIESCRLGISVDLWLEEMESMQRNVAAWCAERANSIASCYCFPRGPQICLFVSPIGSTYDFDLAEQLTDLNLTLLREYNVGTVEVYQVPHAELNRFIDPQTARHIHGQPIETPGAVDA
ncbi:MAG: hypothetical protein HZA51_06635 [Planctomycetes bacterium]|nr:hypothetical protein [Planctomycetota bacterium]